MGRIHVRVEQADRDRLDAVGDEPGNHPSRARLVEVTQGGAVGEQALIDLAPEVTGHQWRRWIDEDVVHVVAALAPDLERVAEACRGEQSRPRALALDQRVGRERGAMDGRVHVAGGNAAVVEQSVDTLLDAVSGILRRGEDLADAQRAGALVHEHEVGERSADIDANPRWHEGKFTIRCRPSRRRAPSGRSRPDTAGRSCSPKRRAL